MTRTTLATALLTTLTAALLATGCAATAEPEATQENAAETTSELRRGLAVDGDACTVRTLPDGTKVPGTEKSGECCATADPNDCVIILKNPFPKATAVFF